MRRRRTFVMNSMPPVILLACFTLQARIFFTGSNPSLSSIALPQDILLIPGGDKISTYTSWQGFPWWGDIDEPENRPYKEYALTGEKTPTSEHHTSMNMYDQRFGMSHWRSERFRTSYDIYYSSQHLAADAKGETNGWAPGGFSAGLPYIYHEKHSIREGHIKGILATYWKSRPIGLSLSLGGVHTSRPDAELHITTDNTTTAGSKLLLWGWDEDGYQPQNEFALGSLFKGDAQIGVTIGDHKIGSHFRLYAGKLDNYDWNGASYDIDPKKIHNYTVRLYGIYNWYKQEKFRFNTTVLTRYTHVDSIGVSMENPGLRLATEKSRTFVFQINPNVNIFPWKYPMSFIDAAILCNYQHMRYDFLRPDGGFAGTGCPDTVWNPDDFSWQDFSYGRENFFELALDIFASIPVFGMRDRSAAVVISTLIWRRYLWMTKYYGSMRNDRFDVSCKRKNFDKEMWLNAVVNFVYRYRSHMFRLDIGQPLVYSLTPRTTIYDASGNVKAGKTTENMWLSQSSFKLGFFYSTDLANFIRYQPFARPEM